MKPKICKEEAFIRTIVPTKDVLPGAMNQKTNITHSYISEVIPLRGQEVMINQEIHE